MRQRERGREMDREEREKEEREGQGSEGGRGEERGREGAQVIDWAQHASHISADVLADPIKPEYIKDVVSLARTHTGGLQVGGETRLSPAGFTWAGKASLVSFF